MSISEVKSDAAKKLYNAEKYLDAKILWEEAIEASGSDDPIHVYYSNKCACNLKLHKFAEALDDSEACTKYKPTWAKGFVRYGGCLERFRRFREALTAFERANELEPGNSEVRSALHRIQRQINGQNYSSSSDDSHNGMGTMFPPNVNAFLLQAKERVTSIAAQSLVWWSNQTETHKWTIGISALVGAYFLYTSIFTGRSSHDYYDDGGGYGGYGGQGMSWTTWGGIMMAAYKLPPMFPELLGQYAQPFFGMSFTTFMWLLRMLPSGGGGNRRGFGRGFGGRM